MTVTIKTPEDIEKMRVAGRLAAEVLEMIGKHVKPGVTTEELDRLCHDYIVNVQQATPAPLNYKGFPKSICTSINHVVCHGIPNDKPLKDGDILNIDITVIKDGYHGDTSKMFIVGKVPEWAERLCQVTQECLYKGIELVKPGTRLGDIGEVIQKHAEKNGFSVVREYCGHGIGAVFHEEPQVLHYGKAGTGMELKEGMTFTIEPMVTLGSATGRERVVRMVEPGDSVGEHEFLTGEPARHGARAVAATRLCTFSHAEVARLLAEHPGIGGRVMRALAVRLAEARTRRLNEAWDKFRQMRRGTTVPEPAE